MAGPAGVAYGQIYVVSSAEHSDLPESFAGQQNGLCGAVQAGVLFLRTGLHTGEVDFTVELHDEAPPIDETWEEIVEASYRPSGEAALTSWGGGGRWPLALDEVDYRVRYCGWGMDAGHQAGPPMDGEPLVDRYLLQFWPAPPQPDRVVKQTSAQAAYWHGVARETPPPPTPEQRAEMERERERKAAEERAAEKLRGWGGTPPSERLEGIWKAYHLALDYRPIMDAAERADPQTQWAVTKWLVHRMCVEADLIQFAWITDALERVDHEEHAWQALRIPVDAYDPPLPAGGSLFALAGWNHNLDVPSKAMTIFGPFMYDDRLEAVVDALWIARDVFGRDRARAFVPDLWDSFPPLRAAQG
ncbi:hypothetical protein Kfla_0139 [Kribbella flavida DSM 17836]|uniref:Uncharacterized protein n=2 Tax=Kribbella flavida TaxID=182640 RepID=D2PRT8_KRIFD|nr:hypothetical protein Kfla_0139 [Kribbella flavida DSM 17836]